MNQQQHIPLSKHERVLKEADPVMNFSKRDEELLQRQLDRATARTNKALSQRRGEQRSEMDKINAKIENTLREIIIDVPGLEVINPAEPREQRHIATASPSPAAGVVTSSSNAATAVSARRTASEHARFRNDKGNSNLNNSNFTSSLVKKGTLTGTAGSGTVGSVLSVKNKSMYTFGFPTPFEASDFNSVLHWASVSYEEARMTAFGPGVDPELLRQEERPHRLLVTVACYLLNEVLSRDMTLSTLWHSLRTPIFDAIFSPSLIATENSRWDSRVRERAEAATRPGASRVKVKIPASEEDGPVKPYPLRHTSYDTVHDYANFRLWIEEVSSVRRDNDILAERVEALKTVVLQSRLVLQMAQRRVNMSRVQSLFYAWRAYTDRMHKFREALSEFATHAHQRRREEVCFLRWRRVTVQAKVERLHEELLNMQHKLHAQSRAHVAEVNDLKRQLKEEADAKESLMLKDEALRAQIMESHELESRVLTIALSRAHEHSRQYKKHAHRWERLANTFRPIQMCPQPPKTLISLAISLRRLEDEMATSTRAAAIVPGVREEMTKFLLRWVNCVMRQSPDHRLWATAKYIEDPRKRPAATPASEDGDDAEAHAFGFFGLHCLLRELSRQQKNTAPMRASPGGMSRRGSATGGGGHMMGRSQSASPSNMDGSIGNTSSKASAVQEAAVMEDLFAVLYEYTGEGLFPTLLMHCQHAGSMLVADQLLLHPTAMLWVLSTLFTAYVRQHMGSESFVPSPGWPTYLKCRSEEMVRQHPNKSLAPGLYLESRPTGGSYILSSDTSVGKRPMSSARSGSRVGTRSGTRRSRKGTGRLNLNSFAMASMDGLADTASDIEVYVGLRDSELPPERVEQNIDKLLATVARSEEYEYRQQQLKRFAENGALSSVDAALEQRRMDDHVGSTRSSRSGSFASESSANNSSSQSSASDGDDDFELDAELLWEEEHDKRSAAASPDGDGGEAAVPPSRRSRNTATSHDLSEAVVNTRLKKLPDASGAFLTHNQGRKQKRKTLLGRIGESSLTRHHRRHRRTAIRTFIDLTTTDRERRQEWLGMARVITSLVTRFRVLDVEGPTDAQMANSGRRRRKASSMRNSNNPRRSMLSESGSNMPSRDEPSTVNTTVVTENDTSRSSMPPTRQPSRAHYSSNQATSGRTAQSSSMSNGSGVLLRPGDGKPSDLRDGGNGASGQYQEQYQTTQPSAGMSNTLISAPFAQSSPTSGGSGLPPPTHSNSTRSSMGVGSSVAKDQASQQTSQHPSQPRYSGSSANQGIGSGGSNVSSGAGGHWAGGAAGSSATHSAAGRSSSPFGVESSSSGQNRAHSSRGASPGAFGSSAGGSNAPLHASLPLLPTRGSSNIDYDAHLPPPRQSTAHPQRHQSHEVNRDVSDLLLEIHAVGVDVPPSGHRRSRHSVAQPQAPMEQTEGEILGPLGPLIVRPSIPHDYSSSRRSTSSKPRFEMREKHAEMNSGK